MRKLGQWMIQCLVDQDLLWRIRKMIITANHMRDLHECIIDHYGIVIRRPAIGTQQYGIADYIAQEFHRTVNNVVKTHRAFANFQSNDGRLFCGETLLDCFSGKIPARARVFPVLVCGLRLLRLRFKLLLGAKTEKSVTGMNEPQRVVSINSESLRLTVGTMRPSDIGTFLPVESQPSEILIDRVFMFAS